MSERTPETWRQTVAWVFVLITASLGSGLALNSYRAETLPILEPLPELLEGEIPLFRAHLMHQSKSALFVDARTDEAFERGRIEGAVKYSHDLPRDRPLVVYCSSRRCGKASLLAANLRRKGYSSVYVMPDGLAGWSGSGYPLVQSQ